jgi:hypothetical protein
MLSCGAAEGLVSKIKIKICVDVFAPKAIKGERQAFALISNRYGDYPVCGDWQRLGNATRQMSSARKPPHTNVNRWPASAIPILIAPSKGPASLTTAGPFYANLLLIQ